MQCIRKCSNTHLSMHIRHSLISNFIHIVILTIVSHRRLNEISKRFVTKQHPVSYMRKFFCVKCSNTFVSNCTVSRYFVSNQVNPFPARDNSELRSRASSSTFPRYFLRFLHSASMFSRNNPIWVGY